MLLVLLNIILMNHNVTFLYFDDCIFNILLELYFTLQSHSLVTDKGSIKKYEILLLIYIRGFSWCQKGQSGFQS